MARQGRGRLSSIDLLPDEAEPDIVWALAELRERKRLQKDILGEFNARLADRGIAPISVGAFNRFSVRKAIQFRQHDEVRRIASDLVQSMGADSADDVTVTVAEMVKMVAYRLLEGGDMDPKGLMELARATQAVVSAQKSSTEHRERLEAAAKAKVEKAVDAVEKEVSKGGSAPDGTEVLKKIREEIYGIFDR